jgi:hypothetical protein
MKVIEFGEWQYIFEDNYAPVNTSVVRDRSMAEL